MENLQRVAEKVLQYQAVLAAAAAVDQGSALSQKFEGRLLTSTRGYHRMTKGNPQQKPPSCCAGGGGRGLQP